MILFPFISVYAQVTDTIIASADTYLSSASQGGNSQTNTNYGNSTQLQAGDNNHKRTLLYFDLTDIPANAVVTSATVTMRVVGGTENDLTCGVYYITSPWNEYSVTWNSPWITPGGDNVQIIPIVDVVVSNTNMDRTWNVTTTVNNWVNGSLNNYGLLIYGTNSANHQKYFASREYSNAAYRPRLTITYTTAADDSLWLRGNYGTNTTTENGAISYWRNVWGVEQFTQDNNAYKPVYRNITNLINFNPTVQFDGNDDFLRGIYNYGVFGSNKFTTFVVLKSSGTNKYIWSQVNNITNAASHSIATYQRVGVPNSFLNGSNTVTNAPTLLGITRTNNNSFSLYFNGNNETNGSIPSFGGSFLGHRLIIGSRGSPPSNTFQGNIGEFMIYPRQLSAVEISTVNSYLAVKYGISLGGAYVASNGTTFWASTAGFNNGIFGLGRDNAFALHQQISTSTTNTNNVVTISTNNDFVLPNAQHTNINNDISYLMIGSNSSGSIIYQTSDLNTNLYASRLNYEWRVQATNFSQTVNLKFQGYGSTDLRTTYLIKKNGNSDFSSGTIEVGSLNSNGEITGVIWNNNDYFTLAFKAVSPGGVSENLKFWVKADYGIILNNNSVAKWNDLSGYNYYVNQEVASNQPLFIPVSQNFNPSIRFSSSEQHFFQRNPFFDIFGGSYSIYLVGYNRSGYGNFITVTPTWSIFSVGILIEADGSNSLRFLHKNPAILLFGDDLQANTTLSNTKGNIMSFYRNTDIKHKFWVNGGLSYQLNPVYPAYDYGYVSDLTVGKLGSEWEDRYLNGEIAEIIIFNTENEAKRIQIESYLAIKYGISLNDGTGVNYTASDSTIKFWNNINNNGYNYDIFGIGKDEISLLEQKQSRSINSDAFFSVYLLPAISDSLPISNTLNTSLFETDKSFLMFGNNNADISTWTHYISLPFNVKYRVTRIWKFQKTGTINDVVITVNPSDLPINTGSLPICLLVSDTPDMSNASVYPMTKVGGTWRVLYNFSEGSYFTFGYGNIFKPLRHGKTVLEGIRFPYRQ